MEKKNTLTRGTRRTGLCLPFNANGWLQAAAARHSEEDHSAFVSNYLSVCSGRKHTRQIRTQPLFFQLLWKKLLDVCCYWDLFIVGPMRKRPEGARFSRTEINIWSWSPRRAPPVGFDIVTVKVSLTSGSASRTARISSIWNNRNHWWSCWIIFPNLLLLNFSILWT